MTLVSIARRAVLALALATGLAGADRVTVFMYSEYIDPEIPKAFTAKTGTEVVIDVYEAQEEMLAKLRAGGAAQYDVVVASDVMIAPMIALKLVRPLDAALIPNARNVDDRFRDPPFDRGNAHSWPYQWGTVGIMYRKDRVTPPISWAMVHDDARAPGPFVLMDEMRSQMGATLAWLGKPMSTRAHADLQAAADALLAAKRSGKCLGFAGGVAGKNRVLAGEAALAVVYNGDAVRAMDEDPDVGFAVPVEGSMVTVDCMLIAAQAPNAAGAHAFIDFILDPAVGATLSNFNRYATPNRAAMAGIAPKDAANEAIYPPAAVLPKLKPLEDVGQDARLYDEAWTRVKSR